MSDSGDPACWLHRVCDACGAVLEDDSGHRCGAAAVVPREAFITTVNRHRSGVIYVVHIANWRGIADRLGIAALDAAVDAMLRTVGDVLGPQATTSVWGLSVVAYSAAPEDEALLATVQGRLETIEVEPGEWFDEPLFQMTTIDVSEEPGRDRQARIEEAVLAF